MAYPERKRVVITGLGVVSSNSNRQGSRFCRHVYNQELSRYGMRNFRWAKSMMVLSRISRSSPSKPSMGLSAGSSQNGCALAEDFRESLLDLLESRWRQLPQSFSDQTLIDRQQLPTLDDRWFGQASSSQYKRGRLRSNTENGGLTVDFIKDEEVPRGLGQL